jgi:hypothetical protein
VSGVRDPPPLPMKSRPWRVDARALFAFWGHLGVRRPGGWPEEEFRWGKRNSSGVRDREVPQSPLVPSVGGTTALLSQRCRDLSVPRIPLGFLIPLGIIPLRSTPSCSAAISWWCVYYPMRCYSTLTAAARQHGGRSLIAGAPLILCRIRRGT